jgi:hypothetical protein
LRMENRHVDDLVDGEKVLSFPKISSSLDSHCKAEPSHH